MSIRLNEIQIAGAGAGKTYSLAKRLINEYNNTEDNKSIYAITFTNAAKKNIKDRVNESLGFIPSNIIITTIHGFLLNEIIYPFNKL
ncbi:MAG: UvrD-helicase domain-containing protein, partial [Tissierellia bacterium]|nr:UvrD-helicase domain-containing protein [Tissierellia bacterium]